MVRLTALALLAVSWSFVIYALALTSDATKDACGLNIWRLSAYRVALQSFELIVLQSLFYSYGDALYTYAGFGAFVFLLVGQQAAFVGLGVSFPTAAIGNSACIDSMSADTLSTPLLIVLTYIAVGVDAMLCIRALMVFARTVDQWMQTTESSRGDKSRSEESADIEEESDN